MREWESADIIVTEVVVVVVIVGVGVLMCDSSQRRELDGGSVEGRIYSQSLICLLSPND